MSKKQTLLLAVIEQTEERRLAGRQPVMTVLRPMGLLARAMYVWGRMGRSLPIDFKSDPRSIEYVVELADSLLPMLMGGNAGKPAGDAVKLVLTPTLESKSGYSSEIGDP